MGALFYVKAVGKKFAYNILAQERTGIASVTVDRTYPVFAVFTENVGGMNALTWYHVPDDDRRLVWIPSLVFKYAGQSEPPQS